MSSQKQRAQCHALLPPLPELKRRYAQAMARVAAAQPVEAQTPESLRTAIIATQIENKALVDLLKDLKLFDRHHYFYYMTLAAEGEAARDRPSKENT